VVIVGMERHNEVGQVVVKGIVLEDGEKEVFLDIFFLGTPDLLTTLIDNGVLVWVVGDSGDTRWGGKEIREEFGFGGKRKWEIGEDRSG
jgi:hypothetical protein